MGKTADSARSRELLRAQLSARLGDMQRQLSENSDRAAHCEKVIRECREQLEEGRDKGHVRWLVPALILTVCTAFLFSISWRILAWTCAVLAFIAFFRWVAAFTHCARKYGRVLKRLNHNIDECDRLNDKSSALRLETLELRQQLDAVEREMHC